MGLLVVVVAAVAAAIVLMALVAVAAVALVQLVLFVTVRNTLLAVAVGSVYWFVASRRRQVARGFYSCTEVPGSLDAASRRTRETLTATVTPPRHKYETTSERIGANAAPATMAMEEEQDEEEQCSDVATTMHQRPTAALDTVPELEAVQEKPQHERDERDSIASSASEAELCADEVAVAAAVAATSMSPASRPSRALPPPTASPTRLPDLRHRKWTHPSRSLPLAPPPATKGESLLQESRKSMMDSSTESRSASNSPRRPERYSSPRSVAMEQKLMKSALESDGYWIGDFRLPPPALKRSNSMGAPAPTVASASTSASPPLTSSSSFRRAGSHV